MAQNPRKHQSSVLYEDITANAGADLPVKPSEPGVDRAGDRLTGLLCVEARLVIEIDGFQHPGEAAAYRRDRRKNALLQASGCFVLRFLAGDLGRHLDEALDTVLRVMATRMRSATT